MIVVTQIDEEFMNDTHALDTFIKRRGLRGKIDSILRVSWAKSL
jgi:hypothetical protein